MEEKRQGLENKKSKKFIDYSQTIDDVYKNLVDIEPNKKLSPIVTELFLIGRKLNISLIYISQSFFLKLI